MMANLIDYLDWRGDVTETYAPYNSADWYMLSTVCRFDWKEIIPENDDCISLTEAADRYFAVHSMKERIDLLASPLFAPMLRKMADSRRYAGVFLTQYRDVYCTDKEAEEQFSALTLILPGARFLVSFQGTDESLAGWKEDCMMSYRDSIPAQKQAARYLADMASCFKGTLLIGGHSKGGNLSVYAGLTASPDIQERISAVYNFDGPGFSEAFLDAASPEMIAKLHHFLPQYSLIGTLFNQAGEIRYTESRTGGLPAHLGFNWETERQGFKELSGLSRSSEMISENLACTLDEMDDKERKSFVDELFTVLSGGGRETLTDITKAGFREQFGLFRTLIRSPKMREFAGTFLELMRKDLLAESGAAVRALTDRQRKSSGGANTELPGPQAKE